MTSLGSRELRTHTSVAALIEISPVSIPGYGDTTAQLRSLDHISTTPVIDSRTEQFRARYAALTNRKVHI